MIVVPGKRYGKRLQKSRVFGGHGPGKKSQYADLLITPLVDMFVIIVLFLIANFSATGEVLMMTKDIQLPEAVNVKEIEMNPVVMVSGDEISISGTIVGRVQDLVKEDYLEIQPLEEKLREMKKQLEDLHAMAEGNTNAFKGEVNIQAHKDVEFSVIKRVMFSCASAGYNNINFATIQKGGDGGGEATAAAKPE